MDKEIKEEFDRLRTQGLFMWTFLCVLDVVIILAIWMIRL